MPESFFKQLGRKALAYTPKPVPPRDPYYEKLLSKWDTQLPPNELKVLTAMRAHPRYGRFLEGAHVNRRPVGNPLSAHANIDPENNINSVALEGRGDFPATLAHELGHIVDVNQQIESMGRTAYLNWLDAHDKANNRYRVNPAPLGFPDRLDLHSQLRELRADVYGVPTARRVLKSILDQHPEAPKRVVPPVRFPASSGFSESLKRLEANIDLLPWEDHPDASAYAAEVRSVNGPSFAAPLPGGTMFGDKSTRLPFARRPLSAGGHWITPNTLAAGAATHFPHPPQSAVSWLAGAVGNKQLRKWVDHIQGEQRRQELWERNKPSIREMSVRRAPMIPLPTPTYNPGTG